MIVSSGPTREAPIPYAVNAILKGSGKVKYTSRAYTRQDAIENAAEIRAQGFDAEIIGPDGRVIEEDE
jgi:hypothetical protein